MLIASLTSGYNSLKNVKQCRSSCLQKSLKWYVTSCELWVASCELLFQKNELTSCELVFTSFSCRSRNLRVA